MATSILSSNRCAQYPFARFKGTPRTLPSQSVKQDPSSDAAAKDHLSSNPPDFIITVDVSQGYAGASRQKKKERDRPEIQERESDVNLRNPWDTGWVSGILGGTKRDLPTSVPGISFLLLATKSLIEKSIAAETPARCPSLQKLSVILLMCLFWSLEMCKLALRSPTVVFQLASSAHALLSHRTSWGAQPL